MSIQQIRLLIFDYNSTIADDFDYHVAAYVQAFSEFGVVIDESSLTSTRGLSTSEKIRRIIEVNECNVSPEELSRRKIDIYNELVREKDIFYPEARATLHRLSKSYSMAMYTGSARAQIEDAIPVEVRKLFRLIVAQEDAIKPKPAPDTLLMVAKHLNFSSSDCSYVGDQVNDMLAAKNAGMLAVGVTHQYDNKEDLLKAGADFVFPDLKVMADFFLK